MFNMTQAYGQALQISNPSARLTYLSSAWHNHQAEAGKGECDYDVDEILEEISFYESLSNEARGKYEDDAEAIHKENHESVEKVRHEIDRLTLLTASVSTRHTQCRTERTLQELRDEYLSAMLTRKQHSKNTSGNARNAFNVLIRHIGNMNISSITTADVEAFITARSKDVKPMTVDNNVRAIRAAFAYAVRCKYADANPFEGTGKPKALEAKGAQYFSDEAFDKFLSIVDDEDYMHLYIFAKETGLRRAELVNLHWDDIETVNNVQTVHVQGHEGESTLKNANSNRHIPLSERALEALEHWHNIKKGKYIFYGRKGKRRDMHALSKSFTRYVQKAPATVDKELTLHSLRHTFATKLFHDGEPIGRISLMLGHADIATTERHYIHQYKEGLGESAERMNKREPKRHNIRTTYEDVNTTYGQNQWLKGGETLLTSRNICSILPLPHPQNERRTFTIE